MAPILCTMHYRRWLRHGSTDNQRNPFGSRHPKWKGDDIGYYGAHDRVESTRGRASGYQCIDCTGQAEEWSYRHGSPNERTELQARKGRRPVVTFYSPDPNDYDPRCRDCHRDYDEHPFRTVA